MWKALLEISLKQYGRGDTTAYAHNQLGAALYRNGQFGEAERNFRESLCLKKELFGNNSKEVANSLNNLASALREQGTKHKMVEAKQYYTKAIGILESIGGSAIADLPFVLECYAKLLNRIGRTIEAIDAQKRAQAIREA